MQPHSVEGARPVQKQPSVVLIIFQCIALAALLAGASLVFADAIVGWADLA